MSTCPVCKHGFVPTDARKRATHVRIGNQTYRLGQTSRNNTQIQCIADDGLVHRVCYWQTDGVEPGARVYTSGNWHEYLGDNRENLHCFIS